MQAFIHRAGPSRTTTSYIKRKSLKVSYDLAFLSPHRRPSRLLAASFSWSSSGSRGHEELLSLSLIHI